MSTVYYIIDKNKKKEYDKFKKFWEEKLISRNKQELKNFCDKNNGELINEELYDDILSNNIRKFSYCPMCEDVYMYRIGHSTCNKFIFSMTHINEKCICNFETLKDFLNDPENQKRYIIMEEGITKVSNKKMLDLIRKLKHT